MRFGRFEKRPRDVSPDPFWKLNGSMAIVAGRGSCILGDPRPRGRAKGKHVAATPVLRKQSMEFHARQKHTLEKTK